MTGDEKSVLHVNIRRRKQWINRDAQAQPTPTRDLFPRKVTLSVWWDKRGIIYWELLPKGKTIDGKTYSRQLEGVRCAVRRVRPDIKKMRLLHDNARPHVCNLVQETVKKFRWTVIQHPPYSPDQPLQIFIHFVLCKVSSMGRSTPTELLYNPPLTVSFIPSLNLSSKVAFIS